MIVVIVQKILIEICIVVLVAIGLVRDMKHKNYKSVH